MTPAELSSMPQFPLEFTIKQPPWVEQFIERSPKVFPEIEDRMRFVISLASENVRKQSGGPFGACVFDAGGSLVAPGVNIVIPSNCSILHAEVVAIAMAQKKLSRYDLGGEGGGEYELVASTEPCTMCFGAFLWSGIRRLVCGARDEDARSIGFDEGLKPQGWQQALEERGLVVVRDVLRAEAAQVLKQYVKSGGVIYNSSRDK
jgi:tRNA(Arg) A34 adenosine deaminase TadA